jgi:hypothetical protein
MRFLSDEELLTVAGGDESVANSDSYLPSAGSGNAVACGAGVAGLVWSALSLDPIGFVVSGIAVVYGCQPPVGH